MVNRLAALLCAGACLIPVVAPAALIYVDNRIGSDGLDGSTPRPLDARTGPVRTLRRAAQLCRGADTIVLLNNEGRPYYGSLQLFGRRQSGFDGARLEIVGNGAVISGLRRVPESSWRDRGLDLWELRTHRKGHIVLVRDGEPLPRHDCDRNTASPPRGIPEGHYCVLRGHVFYQAVAGTDPATENIAFAREDVGITLYKVRDILVRDLTLRHFRLDGVNAADSAANITLENVTIEGCGRAGIAVFGASDVRVVRSRVAKNVEHSILLAQPAAVVVEETELDREPTVRSR